MSLRACTIFLTHNDEQHSENFAKMAFQLLVKATSLLQRSLVFLPVPIFKKSKM